MSREVRENEHIHEPDANFAQSYRQKHSGEAMDDMRQVNTNEKTHLEERLWNIINRLKSFKSWGLLAFVFNAGTMIIFFLMMEVYSGAVVRTIERRFCVIVHYVVIFH